MDENTVVPFKFSIKHINIIIEAIAEFPLKNSINAYMVIKQQVDNQLKDINAPINDDFIIDLQIVAKVVDFMLETLHELPFKKAADVINSIHQQAQTFLRQQAEQQAQQEQKDGEKAVEEQPSAIEGEVIQSS